MAFIEGLGEVLGALRGSSAVVHPHGTDMVQYVGPTVSEVLGMGPEQLFKTQPHLRTVITFVARNLAQLPLHTFSRVGDDDRRREHDDPLAKLFKKPNPSMTTYELMYALACDLKLYDVAIWALATSSETESGWALLPIPPAWLQQTFGGNAWAPGGLVVGQPNGTRVVLENKPGKPPQFIMFHGYRPGKPDGWVSPVESLKEVLAEQIQAWSYRQQVWQRGGRVGAYLTRPAGAPAWSPEARTKFGRDWREKWTGKDGPQAGGTPILEDGMTLGTVRFNAREEEWSEVAKLSLATVAAVYHTNPTMVGILDNANFSNVREFKQMLYTDTLGPDMAMIEDRINSMLVPVVAVKPALYTEFNINEKLQGSFEEQSALLSTSTGAPWLTRNEARARQNLPRIDGGDDLIVPLNVISGGLASPRDTDTSLTPDALAAPRAGAKARLERAKDGGVQVKAETDPAHEAVAAEVLRRYFKRQRAAVLKRLTQKAPEWWDEDRWNDELADDLYALALQVTEEVGPAVMETLGLAPDAYDPARTQDFLKAVAESRAGAINSTTLEQLKAALDDDLADADAERATPEGVFDQAEDSRLGAAAAAMATTLTAFAVMEAGQQLNRPDTVKTWNVNSGKPRASHAAMDGETVPVEEPFSNGAMWPGDAVLGADGTAGCMCGVTVTVQ